MNRLWILLTSFLITPWARAQEAADAVKIPVKVSELNTRLFHFLYDWSLETYASISEGIASLADFALTAEWLMDAFSKPDIRSQIIEFSLEFTASLVIAILLERMLTPIIKPYAKRLRETQHWEHFWRDMSYVSVSLIPIIIFGFSFYFTFRLLEPVGAIYLQIATIFINGVAATWAFIRTSRLILLPHEQNSHIPFSDASLRFTHRWMKYLAITILTGYFLEEIGKIIGLPQEGHRLVLQFTTLIVLMMSLRLVFGLDMEYSTWLYNFRKRKGLEAWQRRFLAFLHFGPFLFVYFMVTTYLTWVLPIEAFLITAWKGLATIVLIPLLFYSQHILHLVLHHWITNHLKVYAPDVGQRAEYYERQIEFVTGSVISLSLALFTIWFWNGDPLFFIKTELGKLIAEKVLSFIVIVGLAFFILRAGRGLISHYFDPKGQRGLTVGEKARMETINGILQSSLQIFIWIPAVLLMLAELDVDILPAAAILSVLGVGLSLGAQSTVQDFLTGLFMLLENTFAVGDVIEVNGKIGTVESLTIRVLRLRAMDGTLSSYPYGKIDKVCNFSRQYSVAIILFTISRDENVEKVAQLISDLDDKLQKSNVTAQNDVVEPIHIDGVVEATESVLTLRVRVKTKPNKHWAIKRLYTKEIVKTLDSKGIKKGFPTRLMVHEDKLIKSRRSK